MAETDTDLLTACRRGDESAWGVLINRYKRLIFTIARRTGLDVDHSAEVFQDVCITLFENLNSIEEPERLRAWLVTIARRKSLQFFYRERALVNNANEDVEDHLAKTLDHAPLPDEVLVRLEEQHNVRTAVESLDERCRKLLLLLFYSIEPPPYAEIAAQMGITEGSIGPTRARCLKKLLRQDLLM